MRYLDLCSGVGMLGLAVKMTLKMRAGIDASPIAYCEIDDYPRAVLDARMEDGSLERAPILRDVIRLPLSDLLGRVDVVAAGFPCPPVSGIGRGLGAQDERWIWPDIAAAIRQLRPRFVFLENVSGLVTNNDGREHGEVLGDLAAIGYDAEWGLLGSGEVGQLHPRRRWWCLAWLPNAVGQRLEGSANARPAAGTNPQRVGGDLPPRWDPLPQPCVHGVADGVADLVDRTKCVGNGVDIVAAVAAYSALGARAGLW